MTLTSPSRARGALAADQTKQRELHAKIQEARKPILEVDAQVAGARDDLVADESAHEASVKAEAAAFIAGHDAAELTAEVANAEAAVERRRRLIAALEGKRAGLENALRDIELNAGISGSASEALIADVVSEVADNVFVEMQAARTKAAAGEAKFLTLKALILSQRWYGLAERLNMKFNSTPAPFWGDQPHPDWTGFLTALATDANAPVPAVPQ